MSRKPGITARDRRAGGQAGRRYPSKHLQSRGDGTSSVRRTVSTVNGQPDCEMGYANQHGARALHAGKRPKKESASECNAPSNMREKGLTSHNPQNEELGCDIM